MSAKQKDLNGEVALVQPEKKVKTSLRYTGDYFRITVPEGAEIGVGQDKINWIAARMKPFLAMPAGEEGERYKKDLDTFVRSI